MIESISTKQKFITNRFLIIFIVLFLVLIFILILIIKYKDGNINQKQIYYKKEDGILSKNENDLLLEGQKFLSPSKLSEIIPSDIILPEDAKIIDIYEYYDKENVKQVTVKYTTSVKLDDVYKLYIQKFSNMNNYFIINQKTYNDGVNFFIQLIGTSGILNIKGNYNFIFKKTFIDLTLVLSK